MPKYLSISEEADVVAAPRIEPRRFHRPRTRAILWSAATAGMVAAVGWYGLSLFLA